MGSTKRAWIAWSSGKDSAWALEAVRRSGEVQVVGMMSTVTRDYDRVSMHGVRDELLRLQAETLGLPIHRAYIPAGCTDEVYGTVMRGILDKAKTEGVSCVVFGDIFLEDVRAYREAQLSKVGMTAVFPLWKQDTASLAREMIKGGLRARITCLDPRAVPREFAGRAFDEDLLAALPDSVDPLGERGEFHTFAQDAPGFRRPIDVRVGETVEREGFVFTDLFSGSERARRVVQW